MGFEIKVFDVKDKKWLDRFIKFPWEVYREDKNWVPPVVLLQKFDEFNPKNPFYSHAKVKFIIAVKDSKILGRLTAHIDYDHINYHKEKVGFFGFFECLKNYEIAEELFKKAEEILKKEGMEKIRGPFSFNTNGVSGLLVKGFDGPPKIMMPYNPPYYKEFIEKYGFKKVMDLYAYRITRKKFLKEIYPKVKDRLEKLIKRVVERGGFRIRKVDFKNLKEELEKIRSIYNDAWSRNWGFIPLRKEEFESLADVMRQITIPDYTRVVETKDGEAVAFYVVLPDVNIIFKKMNGKILNLNLLRIIFGKVKDLPVGRLLLLGVKRKYQKTGIVAALLYEAAVEGIKKGLKEMECSWILETNLDMAKPIEYMGGEPYRIYRIYEKKIE